MKNRICKTWGLFFAAAIMCGCGGGKSFGQNVMTLQKEIPLPGVEGRIDHLDIDLQNQILYVAALGNNTVEVVDLKSGKTLHTITGLAEPQGLAWIPKHHELLVANGGTGECIFYDAAYNKIGSVKYDDDADDVRYDPAADLVYVGYGSGGIGIIDAGTHKQTGDIKLPAHPESFQIDRKENRVWVNLPGAGMIGVADMQTKKLVAQWKKVLPRGNFPMAYDEADHLIFTGYRYPATFKVLDSRTGKELYTSGMVGDVDDFYWDTQTKQVFISGGGGAVDVFKMIAADNYKRVAHIATRNGARTSLLVPELRLFILAGRAVDGKPAALWVYRLTD